MTCRSTTINCFNSLWLTMDWAHCEITLSGKPLPCLLQFLVFWKRPRDCSGYCECDLRYLSYYFYHQEGLVAWSRDHKEMFPVCVKCSPGACVAQWSYFLSQYAQMKMGNKTSLHNNVSHREKVSFWNTESKRTDGFGLQKNPEKLKQVCNQGSFLIDKKNSVWNCYLLYMEV